MSLRYMRRGTGVLLLLAASCAAPDGRGEHVRATAERIVDGWDASGDSEVVALASGDGAVCSGTLVAPRVVLSAAHCGALGASVVVFEGGSLGAPVAVPIATFVAHPEFDGATLANDVALVVLAEGAPRGVSAVPLATRPFGPEQMGAGLRVVGYGRTALADPATRQQGWVSITDIQPTSVRTKPGPSQPCHGDSGGPGFASTDAGEVLAGVISSGDPACTDHANLVRVDAYVTSFLAPMLAAVADGAARVGQRCYQPDNCVDGATCLAPTDGSDHAYCTRACDDDGSCPPGMTCNAQADGSKLCTFATPPGQIGSSCIVDADCDSQHCARGANGVASCADTCIANVLPCKDGFTCAPDSAHPGHDACFVATPDASVAPQSSAAPAPRPPPTTDDAPIDSLPPAPPPHGGCAVAAERAPSHGAIVWILLGIAILARRGIRRTHRLPGGETR